VSKARAVRGRDGRRGERSQHRASRRRGRHGQHWQQPGYYSSSSVVVRAVSSFSSVGAPKCRLASARRAHELRHLAAPISPHEPAAWQTRRCQQDIEGLQTRRYRVCPAGFEALQRLRRRHGRQAVCALVSRQLSMDVDTDSCLRTRRGGRHGRGLVQLHRVGVWFVGRLPSSSRRVEACRGRDASRPPCHVRPPRCCCSCSCVLHARSC
jgi:hypothetical protein